MWVRAELKQRAKQNLKRYYWSAVVVCCLFFVLQYATGVNGNSAPNPGGSNEEVEGYIGDNDISYDAEYDAEYLFLIRFRLEWPVSFIGIGQKRPALESWPLPLIEMIFCRL